MGAWSVNQHQRRYFIVVSIGRCGLQHHGQMHRHGNQLSRQRKRYIGCDRNDCRWCARRSNNWHGNRW
jgi:hypothetical protein